MIEFNDTYSKRRPKVSAENCSVIWRAQIISGLRLYSNLGNGIIELGLFATQYQ